MSDFIHQITLDFSDRPSCPSTALLFEAPDEETRARAQRLVAMLAEEHNLFAILIFDNPASLKEGVKAYGSLYVEMSPTIPYDQMVSIPGQLAKLVKATEGTPILPSTELRADCLSLWVRAETNRRLLHHLTEAAAAGEVPPEALEMANKLVPQVSVYQHGADAYRDKLITQIDAALKKAEEDEKNRG